MNKTLTRPKIVTNEHLEYLDELRESGETNMYGAVPFIQSEFDLNSDEAGIILSYWMKSFGKEER